VIVGGLLRCGASVQSLAAVGKGCPDIVVGFRGRTYLMEIKNPDQRGAKLTEDQEKWHREWRGQVVVVETVEQALAAIVETRDE
jgi:hypothetical protein